MVIDEVAYLASNQDPVDTFLEHFGVKGMKWGVRKKGEVSAEKQAKRESKAKKFDEKAKVLQTKISAIDTRLANKTHFYDYYSRRGLKKQKSELSEAQQRALSDAEAKRQGKLSHNQRKLAIGAGAAAAILATYGAYKFSTSGEMNRQLIKGKRFLSGDKSDNIWKLKPELAKPDMDVDGIMNNVVKHVNPGYGEKGTKVNCRRATFAYEMRRRGHDVSATRTVSGHGQTAGGIYNALDLKPGDDFGPTGRIGMMSRIARETSNKQRGKHFDTSFSDAFEKNPLGMREVIRPSIPGFEVGPRGSASSLTRPKSKGLEVGIFRSLTGQPDGARGELGVTWGMGGGHSMAWEIVKGQPVIFDAQSGKKYTAVTDLINDFGKIGGIAEAGVTRLDNVPLNQDFLMRWLKDAA